MEGDTGGLSGHVELSMEGGGEAECDASDSDAAGEFLPELNWGASESVERVLGPASFGEELMVCPGDAALAEVQAAPGGIEGVEDLRAVSRGIGDDQAHEAAGRAADAEDVADGPVHRWGVRSAAQAGQWES